jgi:hypothetical protein
MARPRLQEEEKLVPVPTRLLPETLNHVEEVADTRGWPIGKTIRKMVEAAITAGLVPPIELPEARNATVDMQASN